MNLHQFVVVTKESPLNHTRENNQKTENTKVVCHLQERRFVDDNGDETGEDITVTVFLEDMPVNIQNKAMELFYLVNSYAENL
jgi:hypothetical protein